MALELSKAKQLGLDRIPVAARRQLMMTPRQVRKKLMDRMLVTWSLTIRRRDGRCVWCGARIREQAHHIVARSRANNPGWFDEDNGMTLCYRCHMHRIQADPDGYIEVRDRFLKERGLTYEGLLRKFCSRSRRLSIADLQILHTEMKRRVIT